MSDQQWDPNKVRVGVARDLRAIAEMYEQLPAHAEAEGKPEGEAVMLLGHVANPEAFGYRLDAARDARHAADQDEKDVLFALVTWEDMIREERDQPTDLRPTVERAVAYLRDSLDWCLSDDENGDIRFLGIDQMQTELREIRGRLESVLHEGVRPDRGVPCLQCGVLLTKEWGDDEDEDRWRCRNDDCGVSTVAGDELNLAVKGIARPYASWLTATDMAAEYRIPVGTLQSWATRGKVRKRKDFDSGRMTYNVADALVQRDGADGEKVTA